MAQRDREVSVETHVLFEAVKCIFLTCQESFAGPIMTHTVVTVEGVLGSVSKYYLGAPFRKATLVASATLRNPSK